MALRLNHPAKTLSEIELTVSPDPLTTREEMDAFYIKEMDKVRGSEAGLLIKRMLNDSFGVKHYKTFFTGHPGVGKSTEISLLTLDVQNRFRTIRFSAPEDMNASGFQPFDVLLIMMIGLTEAVHNLCEKEDTWRGKSLPDTLLQDIHRWFDAQKFTTTTDTGKGLSASAGIKPTPISDTLSALLGLFIEVKGDIKYATNRKEEIVEYRMNSLSSLLNLVNRLLDQASILLKEAEGKEWIIVGEDFDKPGIPESLLEKLFVHNSHIFQQLRCHLIFNIPVALAYSSLDALLTLEHPNINDTPIYDKNHQPHTAGRDALKKVLEARVDPSLFAEHQQERVIVASGGILDDLFALTLSAARSASVREDSGLIIGEPDVTKAIASRKRNMRNRLGTSPYDKVVIPYEDKAARLMSIYNREPNHDVMDTTLLTLLNARAVLEYNGDGWFGIHPLVVDILADQQRDIPKSVGDKNLGGTI